MLELQDLSEGMYTDRHGLSLKHITCSLTSLSLFSEEVICYCISKADLACAGLFPSVSNQGPPMWVANTQILEPSPAGFQDHLSRRLDWESGGN